MASENDLGTYEMLWDCKSCGTEKLLGKTHRFCPSCGAPQNPAWRYFPSDADKIAVHDHVYTGVDVICPACDVPNSRAAKHCVACGSELVKSKDAPTRRAQIAASDQGFLAETAKDAKRERDEARALRDAPAKKKGIGKLGMSVLLCAVLAAAALIVALSWKREAFVTVSAHRWSRNVEIERLGPQNESAWCNETPRDAYHLSRSREVRSHRKVADGKTCKTLRKDQGDGTFKEVEACETKYRDEPIYDDRCSFTVDRWRSERSLEKKGKGLAEAPAWPAVQLRAQEREGTRSERYDVDLVRSDTPGKVSTCSFPLEKWQTIAPGSRWRMRFAVVTGLADCASMSPLPE